MKLEAAERTSKIENIREMVMADIPVDMEAFCDFMTRGDGLLDSLKKKAPYLKNFNAHSTIVRKHHTQLKLPF